MSRAIRMVPPDWEHPSDWRQQWDMRTRRVEMKHVFMPLYGRSFTADLTRFAQNPDDFDNVEPHPDDYMPEFPEGTATWYMMYEEVSEGTPISPAFETIEELAHWLADTGASAFGGMTATYEQWLATCRSGWAPSAVGVGNRLVSGVEAVGTWEKEK